MEMYVGTTNILDTLNREDTNKTISFRRFKKGNYSKGKIRKVIINFKGRILWEEIRIKQI